jgi:hypothetical protein
MFVVQTTRNVPVYSVVNDANSHIIGKCSPVAAVVPIMKSQINYEIDYSNKYRYCITYMIKYFFSSYFSHQYVMSTKQ